MKKLLRDYLIVVLILVLAFGVLQPLKGGTGTASSATPNVGWNTQATGYLPGGEAEPNVGWNSRSAAFVSPVIQPCVGWNS
jgi:hypothetical protein